MIKATQPNKQKKSGIRASRVSCIIGVLDIQGSVDEHISHLKKIRIKSVRVKSPKDLDGISGLIIPGGESTVISDLLNETGLSEALLKQRNLPIWGTCAGAILLAKRIREQRGTRSLRKMNITIERNGYGRQQDSFEAEIYFKGDATPLATVFIRAPRIKRTGWKTKILAVHNNEPVLVQQGNMLASTFHPELTSDLRIHKYFAKLCRTASQSNS